MANSEAGSESEGAEDEGNQAVILDVLPRGRSEDNRPRYRRSPVAFAVGVENFSLYEIRLTDEYDVSIGDRIVIGGPAASPDIEESGPIEYEDITGGARSELEYAVTELIDEEEQRFVEFFNDAQPITTRLHSLDLLPGIGETLRNNILDARRREPFESFADLEERVSGLHDPRSKLSERILEEIQTEDLKYRLFARDG